MVQRARIEGRPENSWSLAWVPIEAISPVFLCAVIKAEDHFFFRHHGIDWDATKQKARDALRGAPTGGASTITQQVVRNAFPMPRGTLPRKAYEMLLAQLVELRLPKRRILEVYMNIAELGSGMWGIGQATQQYFGQKAETLDAAESAFLVSRLAAPRAPLVGANAARARLVQLRVLIQLRQSHVISTEEYESARHELLPAASSDSAFWNRRAESSASQDWRESWPRLDEVLASRCGLERELRSRL